MQVRNKQTKHIYTHIYECIMYSRIRKFKARRKENQMCLKHIIIGQVCVRSFPLLLKLIFKITKKQNIVNSQCFTEKTRSEANLQNNQKAQYYNAQCYSEKQGQKLPWDHVDFKWEYQKPDPNTGFQNSWGHPLCIIFIWESTKLKLGNARATSSYGLESIYVMTHTLLHCHTPVTPATRDCCCLTTQ